MFVLHSYQAAVILCVLTMLCWGSWANTQKLTGGRWRFELFYWDYVFGVVILTTLAAFTLGSMGVEGRGFLADAGQARLEYILATFLGGVVFNAANILLVAAIDIAGMAVAFPVGIGLALVVGVVVNYLNRPSGDVRFLAGGVALVMVAILLDALAYRRLPGQGKGVSSKGLVLSVLCGLLMGSFYYLVQWGMSGSFSPLAPGRMGPYTAVYFFAVGILTSNLLFNRLIMAKPFNGPPVTWADYMKGTLGQHLLGLLGGMIWAVGMTANIIASGRAGPAVSYGLGQGATMIAALWGVFVWREFRGTSTGVKGLLALMFAAYLGGLALVTATQPGDPTAVTAGQGPTGPKLDIHFVPTPQKVVDKMLEMAGVQASDVLYDLGCGDGRIVATAAEKFGCRAKGFDLDPDRVEESKGTVKKRKVENLVEIQQKNIFDLDLSEATVVTLYLLPELNVRLIPQLEKLKPGSRIVSHDFDMKGIKPDQEVDFEADGMPHIIYLWTTPLKNETPPKGKTPPKEQ